ncbi:unnamed protein product [Effrenium voratum]|nr:unnamed protein product [Effrenium voratum]
MDVERRTLRALLRLARGAGTRPSRLAAMLGRAPRLWDPQGARVVAMPSGDFPWCEELLRQCQGGATEYALPRAGRRAARAVRWNWHSLQLLGLPYLPQAAEAQARLETAVAVADQLMCKDSEESERWKLSFCSPEEDHGVEVGDLLITHPLSGLFQEPFDQAVILVVKISRDAELVQGLVLNKEPTENVETLAQLLVDKSASLLTSSWNGAAFRDLPLLEQPLLPGGPTLHGRLEDDLFWLHCHTDVPGATGLRLGLACGGDLAAARAGGGGLRVFRGSACWDRRQLQLEKQRGVWVHARAGFHKGGQEALRQLAMGEASNGWRRALRAAGLPALANFPRGDVDRLLKDYVGSHQRALAMKN